MTSRGRAENARVRAMRATTDRLQADAASTAPRVPDHEAIYLRIREMILFGDLAPGQAVTILGMKSATQAGMTPVREAIRRLVAEGALTALENRRVCVPELSADRLEEIAFARLALEPKLAELAARAAGEAVFDTLDSWDRRVDVAIETGDIGAYLRANYHFHFCLYRTAAADVLHRIAQSLWLQVGPALRIVCGRYGTSELPDLHKDAVTALRAGDPAAVAVAVEQDIRQGMDLIREGLR